ncbi:MAG: GNAT family N-acetyltransferase [Methylophilaceae bacterium]
MHNACKHYGLQVLQKLTPEFYIKEVTWSTHETALRLVREQVFVVEQQVPEAIEWDGLDATAHHLLVCDVQAEAIGCARILDNGSIGRMAVMTGWRGVGVGKLLLARAIDLCKQRKCKKVTLSAQTHAVLFYEQAGFTITSEPYLDANIWHVDMQLNI